MCLFDSLMLGFVVVVWVKRPNGLNNQMNRLKQVKTKNGLKYNFLKFPKQSLLCRGPSLIFENWFSCPRFRLHCGCFPLLPVCGWLVGWLGGWLVCWLTGWLAGWPVGWRQKTTKTADDKDDDNDQPYISFISPKLPIARKPLCYSSTCLAFWS